jgi:hypothetical protein
MLIKIEGMDTLTETVVSESRDQEALGAERDTLQSQALARGATLRQERYAVRQKRETHAF